MSDAETLDGDSESLAPTMEETMGAVFDKLNAPEAAAGERSLDDSDTTGAAADESTGDTQNPDSEPGDDKPPATWSPDEQAEFKKLPKEIANAVLRREKERERAFASKTEGLAEQRRQIEALDAAIGPHRASLTRQGMSDADAVRYLVAAHEWLESDPRAAIAWLSQRYVNGTVSATSPTIAPTVPAGL